MAVDYANYSNYKEWVVNTRPFGFEYFENLTYHFPFEEVDPYYWYSLCKDNWQMPFYFGAVYIMVIYGIQAYLKNRQAFELRMPLFWWNLSLGVFSIFGFVRIFPGFLKALDQFGFYSSICERKGADIQSSAWVIFFVLSKFWELGDTVFIVLRKRPLVFLQWYHHLVTMTAAWLLAPFMEPVTRWYMVLNYGVHSLMYPYFAFKGIGIKIPNLVANLITTLQLIQMIAGFGVNVLSLYYQQSGHNCIRHPTSIKVFAVVYGTFIVLFGKLFYDAVIKSGRAKREKMMSKKIK